MTHSLKKDLRDYQKEDLTKLISRKCMGCFNEQRTGKTPTAIAVAVARSVPKILVVCPASAVYPWCNEWEDWTDLPVIALVGTLAVRRKLIQSWNEGVAVISYDSLKATQRSPGVLPDILKAPPQMVVADEAHRFRGRKTAVAQTMMKLTKCTYRLALTGTPAYGKPHDIFNILQWLYPKVFTSYWKFIEHYFETEKKHNKQDRVYIDVGQFKPGKELALQKLLEGISTQRKRKDVMEWLTDKSEQIVRLPLTKEQSAYLKELREFWEISGTDVITVGVLDRLIRERQICLAPQLLDLKGSSPKLAWLIEYLTDYPEKPVVIFSKFTSFIQLMQKALADKKIDHAIIVGSTSLPTRHAAVGSFQTGKLNVLLIQIDAGKEALTLDRGECIIFTDEYPPVSDIAQAEDRITATTVAKAKKPHHIIRLVMSKSYEVQIRKALQNRWSETDLLNDYRKHLKEV